MLEKIFLLSVVATHAICGGLRFTNVRCTSLDPEFLAFEYCFLKSVNRTYSYLSIKAKLLKRPVVNFTVNWSVFKRANGLKPFLYNITLDGCKFMKNRNSNIIMKYMHDLFRSYSNINHTCPYDHDILVEKLDANFVNILLTKNLPMPKGEYAFDTNWIFGNRNRANVRVFASLN